MNNTDIKGLMDTAVKFRKRSYSPYSGYSVGAAIETENGEIFGGCNIENAAFTPGICAERNAVYKAVSEGHKRIRRVLIAGSQTGDEISQFAYPCGVCRQVIREFCDPDDCQIIILGPSGEYKIHTLSELLPMSFGPENLE